MVETEPDSTNKIIDDKPMDDKNATTLKRICFSDVDGTLVRLLCQGRLSPTPSARTFPNSCASKHCARGV